MVNEPAFPGIEGAQGHGNYIPFNSEYILLNQGMTLLDYFAAHCYPQGDYTREDAAVEAYRRAKAMLELRQQYL